VLGDGVLLLQFLLIQYRNIIPILKISSSVLIADRLERGQIGRFPDGTVGQDKRIGWPGMKATSDQNQFRGKSRYNRLARWVACTC